MTTLPAGIRRVYNALYKRKSSGAVVPTPSEIKQYFEAQGFDGESINDEEFNQVIHHFSGSGLSVIEHDDSEAMPSGKANANTTITNDCIDNTELVRSTAQSLGIVLDTQEISDIAANVNNSSDDLHDSLDDIKSAIIAFVRYKSSLNSQRINQVVEEINDIVTDEFTSNSRQLTQGLQAINRNMQQQNADFKRKVNAAISAFKVPTAG
ncbi:hypothetical protein A6S26_34285 [Nostoc sp. ATCC 43529]|nr:hypothetical protein A6S26_34285 [Nostoc sp. ATCC 43529]